jgi:hypothetical protein
VKYRSHFTPCQTSPRRTARGEEGPSVGGQQGYLWREVQGGCRKGGKSQGRGGKGQRMYSIPEVRICDVCLNFFASLNNDRN